MEQWIPFREGEYIVKQAFLLTSDKLSINIAQPFIEVYTNPKGQRLFQGHGMIRPLDLVELHEEHEEIDLIMDLGGEFKYYLEKPVLKAGKVFAPDVSSALQFYPSIPWKQISETNFEDIVNKLNPEQVDL